MSTWVVCARRGGFFSVTPREVRTLAEGAPGVEFIFLCSTSSKGLRTRVITDRVILLLKELISIHTHTPLLPSLVCTKRKAVHGDRSTE